MIKTIQTTLDEFVSVLLQLDNDVYTRPCNLLSDATIGQHTRHIIELFQCLLKGYHEAEVNYDKRNRDKQIENDEAFAIQQLITVRHQLDKKDKDLFIVYELNEHSFRIGSNYYREAMYNLEHTIHHLALIKVALHVFSAITVSDSFGVAPSTLKYRSQCAQ